MRVVEVRRHSVRTLPQEDLSPEGVKLARSEGRRTGPFQLVIASPIRRAVQTAVAMGYPRPRLDPRWAGFADDVRLRHAWPVSFTTARDILVTDAGTRRAASDLLQWVGEAAGEVSEGERVLIVTHGGFPELLAVAELPAVDPGGWGGVLRCMEGVRLRLDGTVPRSLEVLRVPDALTRM